MVLINEIRSLPSLNLNGTRNHTHRKDGPAGRVNIFRCSTLNARLWRKMWQFHRLSSLYVAKVTVKLVAVHVREFLQNVSIIQLYSFKCKQFNYSVWVLQTPPFNSSQIFFNLFFNREKKKRQKGKAKHHTWLTNFFYFYVSLPRILIYNLSLHVSVVLKPYLWLMCKILNKHWRQIAVEDSVQSWEQR